MDGKTVLIAAQEGGFMGGAIGEIHGAKLTGLLERALDIKPDAVLLLFDSGGVRLQEANAGLNCDGRNSTRRSGGAPCRDICDRFDRRT